MKRTEETLHLTGRRFSRDNQKVDTEREREKKKKGEREGGGWVGGEGGRDILLGDTYHPLK